MEMCNNLEQQISLHFEEVFEGFAVVVFEPSSVVGDV